MTRHRKRRQLGNIGAIVDCPDRLDQGGNVIARNGTRRRLAQLVFKLAIGHRIVVTAARGTLMELVVLAVGGDDLDRGGGGREAFVALDRDFAAERGDAPVVDA